MMEVKDSEIKLFGKKIALLENGKSVLLVVAAGDDSPSDSTGAGGVCNGENSTGSDSNRSLDNAKVSRIEESEVEEGGDDDEKDSENQETGFDKVQAIFFLKIHTEGVFVFNVCVWKCTAIWKLLEKLKTTRMLN